MVSACNLLPVVAVPAKDEADRIVALLDSLHSQTWSRDFGPLAVVLVVNNSSDHTVHVAKGFAQSSERIRLVCIEVRFPAEQAHVGAARRLAMDTALHLLPNRMTGVILTTDADARPDENWVTASLNAVAGGAGIVGGEISGDPVEEAALGAPFLARARLQKKYDQLADYLAHLMDPDPDDPWPRHQDHTGASLAVRADAFVEIGGLPPLATGEDLALVAAMRRAGSPLRHNPDAKVTVSARLDGRAPGGMAACLRSWISAEQAGEPLFVEHVDHLTQRLRRRALIRSLPTLSGSERPGVCQLADLSLDCVARLLSNGANSHAMVEIFAPQPTVPVERQRAEIAIDALSRMIFQLEGPRIVSIG